MKCPCEECLVLSTCLYGKQYYFIYRSTFIDFLKGRCPKFRNYIYPDNQYAPYNVREFFETFKFDSTFID